MLAHNVISTSAYIHSLGQPGKLPLSTKSEYLDVVYWYLLDMNLSFVCELWVISEKQFNKQKKIMNHNISVKHLQSSICACVHNICQGIEGKY